VFTLWQTGRSEGEGERKRIEKEGDRKRKNWGRERERVSRAPVCSVEYRESTQYTLISENRVFIQTNSHGTFLWILMPVSTTLASQELLRPSLKSCSPCDIFSANEGA
jgi:hypothetical protein